MKAGERESRVSISEGGGREHRQGVVCYLKILTIILERERERERERVREKRYYSKRWGRERIVQK